MGYNVSITAERLISTARRGEVERFENLARRFDRADVIQQLRRVLYPTAIAKRAGVVLHGSRYDAKYLTGRFNAYIEAIAEFGLADESTLDRVYELQSIIQENAEKLPMGADGTRDPEKSAARRKKNYAEAHRNICDALEKLAGISGLMETDLPEVEDLTRELSEYILSQENP